MARSIAGDTANARYDTALCALHGFCVAIQFLYRDRGELRHGTPARARRHGLREATTRHLARGVRVAWVLWVCTLCTRPSFDSVHYLQSRFGSLFMNTIHRVFKK